MTNRELDAAIAEALGNEVYRDEHFGAFLVIDGMTDIAFEYEVPAYSTDPVAADALMRALRERGWGFGIDCEPDGETQVCITEGHVFLADETDDTWTLALAKAALSALTAGKP